MSAVGYSIYFSLFFYPSLYLLIGPRTEKYDYSNWRCCGKKSNTEDREEEQDREKNYF